jgi:16S rRNA (guanine527-N7)-methyltransferase
MGFAQAWHSQRVNPPGSLLDLGTGGGVPGLVLLDHWQIPGVLLDGMERRTSFLREALDLPGAPANVTVVTARAEDAARVPGLDSSFEVVTARSFGPPAAVAECGVRFLEPDGLLVVSEPPGDTDRWPAAGLAELNMCVLARFRAAAGFVLLERTGPIPELYPRRVGVPTKKPLF